MSEKLSNFRLKVFGRFVKTSFDVCRGMLWGSCRKNYISFHHFRILSSKTNRNFGEEFSASLSKMQFGCPMEHFERKTSFLKKPICSSWSFLDVEPNFFGTFAKTIQHGCHHCIRGIQRNSVSKNILFKKMFFILLVCLVKKVSISDKKFSAGCSNLYSTCPEESLRIFSWKKLR